jgi:hypothetical protein
MHTRRLATFLLGIWIGCGGLMALLVMENLRSAARVMDSGSPPAYKLIDKLGSGDAALLLNYQAAEESRYYLSLWENAQMALAIVLGACLYLGTQKKILPLTFCGAMLALVLFQHFLVAPELAFRAREAAFPPGNAAFGTRTRLLLMEQVYWGVEGGKFLIGAVLTVYLLLFRSGRRSRMTSADLADTRSVRSVRPSVNPSNL